MFGKRYFIDLKHKVMIQKQKGIFCARLLDSAIDEKLFFQNSTAAQQYDTGGYYDSPFFAITAQTFLHIRAAQTFFFSFQM